MKNIIITLCIIACTPLDAQENILLSVTDLKCENFVNPLGIDRLNPGLSWQIKSDKRNVMQSAYRILVSEDPEKLDSDNGDVWDSKKVRSDQSILVVYDGNILKPPTKYYWKVMVWDASDNASGWSETAYWQIGLLSPADWDNAQWICYEDMPSTMRVIPGVHLNGNDLGHKCMQRPVIPNFRKEFSVKRQIESATLSISGLGHYEVYLNGNKIGKSFLSPGWTHYNKSILYNTYDITDHVKTGKNVIGAIVGNGFYNINRERYRKLTIAYGTPKMICKLSI